MSRPSGWDAPLLLRGAQGPAVFTQRIAPPEGALGTEQAGLPPEALSLTNACYDSNPMLRLTVLTDNLPGETPHSVRKVRAGVFIPI